MTDLEQLQDMVLRLADVADKLLDRIELLEQAVNGLADHDGGKEL